MCTGPVLLITAFEGPAKGWVAQRDGAAATPVLPGVERGRGVHNLLQRLARLAVCIDGGVVARLWLSVPLLTGCLAIMQTSCACR